VLSYKEYDNAQAVEIVLKGRVSTEEFDSVASKLEAFIQRRRMAVVCNPDTHHLWSSLVAPFMSCTVEHFVPGQEETARDWLMWPEGAAD
jgi:hypothetical protein